MKRIFTLIIAAVTTTALFAGSPVIEGRITDASTGESLTGVKIIVEQTGTQVITDFDGYFRISEMPEGSTVKLSYLSYQTKEVTIDRAEKGFLNIEMESVGAFRTAGEVTASNAPSK